MADEGKPKDGDPGADGKPKDGDPGADGKPKGADPDADADDDDEDGDGKPEKNPELEKAIRRRDRALQRVRDLEAQLAEASKPKDGDGKPDPVAVANERLVRAEARTVLAANGVKDKKTQATIVKMLNLSGVTVDASGEVDTDEIEDVVSTLREAFAGKAAPSPRKPPPGGVDPRDRGTGGQPTDPDSARYRRIMGRG